MTNEQEYDAMVTSDPEYIPGGNWTVWGDESTPIYQNVSEEFAKAEVDRLVQEGRRDVYAESLIDDRQYEP